MEQVSALCDSENFNVVDAVFACRDKGSFRHWLSFSYKPKQLQKRERGIYFVGGLCLSSHAALTSVGAQGFGLGGLWRVEVGKGM